MKVLVHIPHPADVHFYKNYIWEMNQKGNEVRIIVTEKDITTDLLEKYGFEYEIISSRRNTTLLPIDIDEQLTRVINTCKYARKFEPDLITSKSGFATAHAAKLTGSESIIFPNNEHATLSNRLSVPFATRIYTNEYFWKDFGDRHVRYPGYHELAYLHPNRFEPDPSVLDKLPVEPDDLFVLMRLVSWEAAHDVGQSGLTDIYDAIDRLESTGARVLLSSEGELDSNLSEYEVNIPPHKIHDLLYYSDLYIGESGTMSSEAAILGTPAIFVSTIRIGYLDELDNKYGLVYNCSGPNRQENGVVKAETILENQSLDKFDERRERLLSNKIDTTKFMVERSLSIVNRQ
ncbi:DUF354 domain-containing protein [Natrinema sp. 1APR25-10V2]|uniref:DUF354 domain-containing protein n=1 Tax=Natrinema sp. 1APR25-10V2 TaxID=2951081 RepID=UPI0028743D27|nr:DUF354 domain-containing protein [Natrinema sp. 1APR25-10V2]MDS0475698.1 DUF354 domain-containing protein [Natrinema sp. 1APR25-10V2]